MIEAEKPFDEAERLRALRSLGILDTPPEERFDRITRLVARLLDVPIVAISLVDHDRQWFKSVVGLDVRQTSREVAFCAHAILGDETFVVGDATEDPRFRGNPLVTDAPRIRAYAGRPLAGPRLRRVGTLCAIDTKPRQWTEDELTVLGDLAAVAERELNGVWTIEHRVLEKAALQQAILDSAKSSMIATDVRGVITVFNRGACDQLGFAAEEAVGRSLVQTLHLPAELEERAAVLSVELNRPIDPGFEVLVAKAGAGDIDENEWTYRRKDGSAHPSHVSVTALRDGDGALEGFLFIGVDITARIRAERDRRNFFTESMDLLCIAGLDGFFKDLNPAWERTLGYSPAELTARPFLDFIHPEDRQRTIDEVAALAGGSRTFQFENRYVCKDGSSRWLEWTATPYPAEGLIYAAARDVTQRREALRLQRESESRAHAILDNSIDAIITIAQDGTIESANRASRRIFGYEADEVIGRNVNMLMPEPYRSEHDGYLQRYMASGEARVIGVGREVTGRRKDGTTFPMDLAVAQVELADRRIFSGMVRDISERKEAERKLNEALVRAEAASRTKSEFLATMSHELRTPLNSVIGFSGILLKNKGERLSKQDLKFLQRISENGQHLLELINSVLDISKVEVGRMEVETYEVDLDELIRGAVATLEPLVEGRSVELRIEIPEHLAAIHTDGRRLKQVLINLGANAVKFTERGSVTLRAECDPQTRVPRAFEVIDTGIGIPAAQIDRVFDAFHQVDSSTARRFEGTGLGLAIVKSLCELMGHRVSVTSEQGVGSVFRVDLCAGQPSTRTSSLEHRPTPPSSRPEAEPFAAAELDRLRRVVALVIDDDPNARLLLIDALDEFGVRVIEARSGPEGLHAAEEHTPDLIVLDLQMPGLNGWETLHLLKANPATAAIPVVVASIIAGENRGTLFGILDALDKPIVREGVARVLGRYLRGLTRRVLVVDDSPASRQLFAHYVSEFNAEVREAANGREALAAVETFHPDLVLLDLMMPVMDGVEFLTIFRQDPRFAAVPVVICTAMELSREQRLELERYAHSLVSKGQEFSQRIIPILRSVLEEH